MTLTRIPMPESPVFASRGTRVKWPTLRKARMNPVSTVALMEYASGPARSDVWLSGEYRTNLNFGRGENGSVERMVFFEYQARTGDGALYLLVWVGNYYDGAVFHCGWQYPQAKAADDAFLERKAFEVYGEIAKRLYAHVGDDMDPEVAAFINANDAADWAEYQQEEPR